MRTCILGLVAGLFLLGVLGLVSGCGDQRTAPATSSAPVYTETIPLWTNQTSNGQWISKEFTVADTLAPINQIGVDAPARLFLWAYIQPDADILWREAIINDTTPVVISRGIGYQIVLDSLEKLIRRSNRLLDSLERYADSLVFAFDSTSCDTLFVIHGADTTWCDSVLFRLYPDSMVLFEDTTGWGQLAVNTEAIIAASLPVQTVYTDSNTTLQHDSTLMGARRDSIGYIVDDRYRLSLWFDDNAATEIYPEALFMTNELASHDTLLAGQYIYQAATANDGMKGCRFELNLAAFSAADIRHIGRPLEMVWTCSPGSVRCLSEGQHTIGARVTGSNTRISATLVLVYHVEQRP